MTANNPEIGNISLMDLLHNVSYMNENKDKNLYLTVYIPTEFSFSVIVLLIIVYSISITLSFIGNLAVIFCVFVWKKSQEGCSILSDQFSSGRFTNGWLLYALHLYRDYAGSLDIWKNNVSFGTLHANTKCQCQHRN